MKTKAWRFVLAAWMTACVGCSDGAVDGATIAASGLGTCARFDERVCCWGRDLDTPTAIPLPGAASDVAVGVFGSSACALVGAEVHCWTLAANAAPKRIGLDRVLRIAGGGEHFCALRDDGTVWCWGYNGYGQLGNGGFDDPAEPSTVPTQVVGLVDAVEIAAGEYHTCARRSSGSVACWGNGFGDHDCNGSCTATPVDVPLPAITSRITAGGAETCAQAVDGETYCWGRGGGAQSPAPVPALAGVERVQPGFSLGCATPSDGRPICWGQLFGWKPEGGHVVPLVDVNYSEIAGLDDVAEYASGWFHACARNADGDVICFGANDTHQLGDGTTTDGILPRQAGVWP